MHIVRAFGGLGWLLVCLAPGTGCDQIPAAIAQHIISMKHGVHCGLTSMLVLLKLVVHASVQLMQSLVSVLCSLLQPGDASHAETALAACAMPPGPSPAS